MKLPIFIDVAIILLISFFMLKKKLNPIANFFIIMILEFLVTTYSSFLTVNLNLWKISDDVGLFIIYRIYVVIVIPFLYLLYFNIVLRSERQINKWIISALFSGVLYVLEYCLKIWRVITYENWNYWGSFIIQLLILSIVYILLMFFHIQMKSERIEK